MGTAKLFKTVITGPVGRLDDAIRELALGHDFHITDAAATLRAIGGLTIPNDPNPYEAPLDAANSLLSRLAIQSEFREFSGRGYTLSETTAFMSAASSACARMITHKNAEDSLVSDIEEVINRLAPFAELPVSVTELSELRRLEVRYGSIDPESYDELLLFAKMNQNVFFFRTGKQGDKVCCVYIALPEHADHIAEVFESIGFEFAEAPVLPDAAGTPEERIAELRMESEEARRKSAAFSAEIEAFKKQNSEELLARHSYLLFMSRAFKLRVNAAVKHGQFYLTGWVPQSGGETFQQDAEALGLGCELETPSRHDRGHTPVKFKSGFFSRIFEPFVEMFGYPDYGEIDPRVFMALTYGIMFGVMFGDIGQGVVLILAGVFMSKKMGLWLGNIISWVGCFATVFGFVYGSFFGNEHILPGFKIMEGGNMMSILIISVVLGVFIIVLCGIMNIITGLRQQDVKKAFFSANGVSGLVFFLAIVAGLATMFFGEQSLFGNPIYIVCCIAVPLLLLFCGEPLAKLIERRHDWKPESVGMFFIEGFFDIFESCLSWFSNCVSFLRVGAYAICHAGMMMVVYLLSGDGEVIWGVALGNIVVMIIEAVLVCIQVLRLEFYEMFGRFYTGRGSPFTPVRVDYAAAE